MDSHEKWHVNICHIQYNTSVTLQCCPKADHVLCADCNIVSPLLDAGGGGSKSVTVSGHVGSEGF